MENKAKTFKCKLKKKKHSKTVSEIRVQTSVLFGSFSVNQHYLSQMFSWFQWLANQDKEMVRLISTRY